MSKYINREKNIEVWNDTFNKQNKYVSIPSTKFKYSQLSNDIDLTNPNYETKIVVQNIDTIDCAIQLDNPLVLNMASKFKAGGGVRTGATAQEEQLFLRSNYDLTLNKKGFYPMNDDEIIYSPQVVIFKESNTYKDIKPFTLDFIACPAIRDPKLINNLYTDTDRNIMEMKIEMIFLTAIKFKYVNLVLGALGCGAYHNPTDEVIEIYNKMLNKYKGHFKNIYFAVYSIRDDNYDKFSKLIKN